MSTQSRDACGGTVAGVDEARAVIERLERIDRLRADAAPAETLLEEVRALVAEAERWSEREGAGAEAVSRCRDALAPADDRP